jgi:predicted ATPase
LRELLRTEVWLKKNCLVAVAGGLGDGTAGLQEDDSFAASRREIEAFADIIFASTPSQREFWLGKKPNADRFFIERTYRALKPCLHGSDAHRNPEVVSPDLERYCWIKGDPTFEALRQVVIEPEERVWLATAPPADSVPSVFISQVRAAATPWLENKSMEINAGLVTVIGARGSGKTALVEMIASGANAMRAALGESSFLKRASSPVDYLANAQVELTWGDESTTKAPLRPARQGEAEELAPEYACYLSQHFVDRLCSAEGLATELRREIERVVFDATDPTERLETDSFGQLASVLVEPIRRQREEIQGTIRSTSESIVQEDLLRDRLPILRKDRDALKKQIEKDRKELELLLPKGKQERGQRLVYFEKACANTEAKIENLRRRRQTLDDLAREIGRIRTYIEPTRLAEMRERFAAAQLSDTDWKAFGMTFMGDVDAVLGRAKRAVDTAIAVASEGDPSSPIDTTKTPPAEWSLKQLRATRDALKKEVGIDAQQQKKYDELQRAIAKEETSLRHFEADIKNAEGADARRLQLINSRRGAYAQVFETFVEEEGILTRLYAPLREQLSGASGALAKLEFVIHRQVNLDLWVAAGEQLLDLRKETRFRGHGTLRREAEQHLLAAWTRGTAEQVAAAMDAFRTEYHGDLVKAMPASIPAESRRAWTQSVATWLYDTTHIHVEYGIQYDGVVIEQLSPGTRGIVLLLLYLALDRQDRRPLIVDQPEENLDPNSVFEELVPHFREARKRRQVIVVTHNANLVVNTDADQVIVAMSVRTSGAGLPNISYRSGSLENPNIRGLVCEILEGGERAFLERERRYRLRWGDTYY